MEQSTEALSVFAPALIRYTNCNQSDFLITMSGEKQTVSS